MATGFTGTPADALLNAFGNATSYTGAANHYMKLHISSPGAAGTSGAAGNTTRQALSWGTSSSGVMLNDTALTWTSVSTSETYTFFSIWDASSAGNCLGSGAVTANAVTAGDTFTIAIGGASATLSVAS